SAGPRRGGGPRGVCEERGIATKNRKSHKNKTDRSDYRLLLMFGFLLRSGQGSRIAGFLAAFCDFLCFLWLSQESSRRERSHAHRPVTSLADGRRSHAGERPATAAAASSARPRAGA